MKKIFLVGEADGKPLVYFLAVAKELYVGDCYYPDGRIISTINIQYRPDQLPVVVPLLEMMTRQGRKPVVYLELTDERFEVVVMFRLAVEVSSLAGPSLEEMIGLQSQEFELFFTAETDLSRKKGEKHLKTFEGKTFAVVVGPIQDRLQDVLWYCEVDSFQTKRPDFFTKGPPVYL